MKFRVGHLGPNSEIIKLVEDTSEYFPLDSSRSSSLNHGEALYFIQRAHWRDMDPSEEGPDSFLALSEEKSS